MGADRDRGLSYDAHGFKHLRSCTQHCDWGCHQEECRYLHIATPPPRPGVFEEKKSTYLCDLLERKIFQGFRPIHSETSSRELPVWNGITVAVPDVSRLHNATIGNPRRLMWEMH